MSGFKRMNEIYGERWVTLMPPAGRGVIAVENVSLDTASNQYTREICRVRAQKTEMIVLQRYGCYCLQPGTNDEWVGIEPKPVSPFALQGRASWDVMINSAQGTGDRSVSLGGVTFNDAVPVPPTPPGMAGIPWFRDFGYQQGDAPIIVGPGETASIVILTYGANGSALTPPPPEFPLTFAGILSGYRLPFYADATIPEGHRRP